MKLGEILKLSEEQNISGNDYPFYGVNKDKDFIPTAATTDGLDKKKYKIIRTISARSLFRREIYVII